MNDDRPELEVSGASAGTEPVIKARKIPLGPKWPDVTYWELADLEEAAKLLGMPGVEAVLRRVAWDPELCEELRATGAKRLGAVSRAISKGGMSIRPRRWSAREIDPDARWTA